MLLYLVDFLLSVSGESCDRFFCFCFRSTNKPEAALIEPLYVYPGMSRMTDGERDKPTDE